MNHAEHFFSHSSPHQPTPLGISSFFFTLTSSIYPPYHLPYPATPTVGRESGKASELSRSHLNDAFTMSIGSEVQFAHDLSTKLMSREPMRF